MHEFLDATKTSGADTQEKLDKIRVEIRGMLRTRELERMDSYAFSKLSGSLTGFVELVKTTRNAYTFLKSLHFKQIKARQFEVKTAHANTFEWIFEEGEKQKFGQWLSGPSGVFWISGKAGSGKSTLMKFLGGHARLRTKLQVWAGGCETFVASHFFWSAGTTMQKSQEGLLRSLLFQIFARFPELIPRLCPNRWDDSFSAIPSLEPWSMSELSQTLESLANLDHLPAKLFLLFDGLDEYDGEHSDIITVVKNMAKSPHIKLCVSSRPWTVFIDAFDDGQWKFYLQDLTRNDIRLYIKDNLEDDVNFRDLKSRESAGTKYLVQQIVSKAEGVFLWVYLVVRSLLRGLTNKDDMSDLENRLAELPGHLETYFKHMLDSIDDVYQQQTAQTFQIMVNASTTLPLIALHFVDYERKQPDYALQHPIKAITHPELVAIVDKKRRQINARCKDLVEVTTDAENPFFFRYRASFLHRTVLDFLRTKDMVALMTMRSGDGFNPNLSLCRAYLAQVKVLPVAYELKYSILRNLILGTIYYAQQLEILDGRGEIALLDELDHTLSQFIQHHNVLWSEIFPGEEFRTILEITVRSGLELYICLKAQACPELLRRSQKLDNKPPLLYYGLQTSVSIRKDAGFDLYPTSEVNISVLRLLLDLGACPGDLVNPRTIRPLSSLLPVTTVWADFLGRLVTIAVNKPAEWELTKFLPPHQQSNAYEACELVIVHTRDRYGKELRSGTTSDIFREVFSSAQARRLDGLLETETEIYPRENTHYVRTYRKMEKPASWWNMWGRLS
jgi:hypothetical protein